MINESLIQTLNQIEAGNVVIRRFSLTKEGANGRKIIEKYEGMTDLTLSPDLNFYQKMNGESKSMSEKIAHLGNNIIEITSQIYDKKNYRYKIIKKEYTNPDGYEEFKKDKFNFLFNK
jgi:hypothetical protein